MMPPTPLQNSYSSFEDGPSAFVVVSLSRWDEHQRRLNAPWRQNRLLLLAKDSGKRVWKGRELDGSFGKKGYGSSGEILG